MNSLTFIDYILLLILTYALYTDIRFRKIFNYLTLSGLLLGILLNLLFVNHGGILKALSFSLTGALLGSLIFFIPFMFGGMGAGDLKLLGMIGAFKGFTFILHAGLFSALAGGAIALFWVVFNKKQRQTVFNYFKGIFYTIFYHTKYTPPEQAEINKRYFPYSLAIISGYFLALFFKI